MNRLRFSATLQHLYS